jgi:hypothetical protein
MFAAQGSPRTFSKARESRDSRFWRRVIWVNAEKLKCWDSDMKTRAVSEALI